MKNMKLGLSAVTLVMVATALMVGKDVSANLSYEDSDITRVIFTLETTTPRAE